jgi:hypothetical protein
LASRPGSFPASAQEPGRSATTITPVRRTFLIDVAEAALNPAKYDVGKKVSDNELGKFRMQQSEFLGAWNDMIPPKTK